MAKKEKNEKVNKMNSQKYFVSSTRGSFAALSILYPRRRHTIGCF